MIKMLRPEDIWQLKLGAPRGNRNAVKTGAHIAKLRALRKNVMMTRRWIALLIVQAKKELGATDQSR